MQNFIIIYVNFFSSHSEQNLIIVVTKNQLIIVLLHLQIPQVNLTFEKFAFLLYSLYNDSNLFKMISAEQQKNPMARNNVKILIQRDLRLILSAWLLEVKNIID